MDETGLDLESLSISVPASLDHSQNPARLPPSKAQGPSEPGGQRISKGKAGSSGKGKAKASPASTPQQRAHLSSPDSGSRGGSGSASSSPSKTLPVSESYFDNELHLDERVAYRAAGLVLFIPNSSTGDIDILMAKELRTKSSKSVKVNASFAAGYLGYTFLGGKREQTDPDPEWTAAREFHEETGRVLWPELTDEQSIASLSRLIKDSPDRVVYWGKDSKYVVFILRVPRSDELAFVSLPDRFSELYGSVVSEAGSNDSTPGSPGRSTLLASPSKHSPTALVRDSLCPTHELKWNAAKSYKRFRKQSCLVESPSGPSSAEAVTGAADEFASPPSTPEKPNRHAPSTPTPMVSMTSTDDSDAPGGSDCMIQQFASFMFFSRPFQEALRLAASRG